MQSLRCEVTEIKIKHLAALAAIGDDFNRLVIIGVEENGPAAVAGPNSADIVVSIDDIAAAELAQRSVTATLSGKSPGDSIRARSRKVSSSMVPIHRLGFERATNKDSRLRF